MTFGTTYDVELAVPHFPKNVSLLVTLEYSLGRSELNLR